MSETVTDTRLQEIEARCAAATPGPWSAVREAGQANAWHVATGRWVWHEPSRSTFWSEEDVSFMAHAREDIPALVVEVRRLRAALTCPEAA